MKVGKAVLYEGNEGDQLALVAKVGEDTHRDLITFDSDTGAAGIQKDVPRRDEGGGHTWRPVK